MKELCEELLVVRLYAFGSTVKGTFRPESSDVDLLVEMLPREPLLEGRALLRLWDELEVLFGRKVDLLTTRSLKNPYLIKEIMSTRQLIYDRTSEKISV
ncbi:MAG: nucleotidyltransferase domain-containing protein [Bacteroidota bacterium]